jgi:hypothetical protein
MAIDALKVTDALIQQQTEELLQLRLTRARAGEFAIERVLHSRIA